MSDTALSVQTREGTGKGVARKLRASGRIPGVLYGGNEGSQSISVDPMALERVLRGSGSGLNTLLDLEFGGASPGQTVALVKELQRHPVSGGLLHADLYRVDLTQKIVVEVPIHLVGRPHGVELGGVLDHMLRELSLECLPRRIPDSIDADVSALEIGDAVHVRDLALPSDVELLTDLDVTVAHVVAPVAEEEVAEEGAEEEGAEAVDGAEAADKPKEGESSDS